MIPFFKPNVGAEEARAVYDVVLSGQLATGAANREFEQLFARQFDYKHVVSVNSGTSALLLSLMALGVGPGDEVAVTSYSIMATVNVILMLGATPIFVDVERDTYNMDPGDLKTKLTKRTKAILPASIFGVPCDAEGLNEASQGIPIVEDAIEAVGSKRNGKFIGSDVTFCTFGFYPNKQMTTAQGGVIVTSDDELADKVQRLRFQGYPEGGPNLWQQGFGMNLRLPDPLAAMGTVQLSRLSEMQDQMGKVVEALDMSLWQYRKQVTPEGFESTHFIYSVEIPEGCDKKGFEERMLSKGVPTRPYFNALTTEPCLSGRTTPCPVAEDIGRRTVALPCYGTMPMEHVEIVADAFLDTMEEV